MTVSILDKRVTGAAVLPALPEGTDRQVEFFAVERTRAAGRRAMVGLQAVRDARGVYRRLRRRALAVRRSLHHGAASKPVSQLHQDWLSENLRLIVAAEKDARDLLATARDYPAVVTAGAPPMLRVEALCESYLLAHDWRFDEQSFVAFVCGAQEVRDLEMGEIFAARPMLQLWLLERLVHAAVSERAVLPALITSLRALADSDWKTVFASTNAVDPVLACDPVDVYQSMEEVSQDQYRHVVAELAKHSKRTEADVAEIAVRLACRTEAANDTDRVGYRRAHVGYYLVDDGLPELRRRVGYRTPWKRRVEDAVRQHATLCYLGGIVALTAIFVAAFATGLGPWATLVSIVLLVIPATHGAVGIMNSLATSRLGPSLLPKLDFSEGIPDECATMVAVPALLLNQRHVHELVKDMEVRYLGNRDRNLWFALVTNSPDSNEPSDEHNQLLWLCERLVRELNERHGRHGHTPFFLFHRFRAYNPGEQRWMGWERKRGKLHDLNQLLRGVRDRFPVKVGNLERLPRIRYVITLDSDTQLPRDAARRLVGTMAHPLNRAVVDPITRLVTDGYGILQPRIAVSGRSSRRSWLAVLFAGEPGFDIYTRAVSDVYQDLFREGIYTGKGIYEIDVFRESLEHRFPANTLLSHDLIEGLFARSGLVSDIELIDDYPAHFTAYCRRSHRWIRGDWQILRWLATLVPDVSGQWVPNPLHVRSRWKILDNLRRSLVHPATIALLVAGWFFLPGPAARWTMAAVGLLLAPAYWHLAFALTRAPWWRRSLPRYLGRELSGFARAHLAVGLHVACLLHDGLLAGDAIVRALARMFVTRRRLLEWETAAETALRDRGAIDKCLRWSPWIACALAAALALLRPSALPAAAPVLAAWMLVRVIAGWLNRAPRSGQRELSQKDDPLLRGVALRTWRFFREQSSERNNWLVPDFVQEDGGAAERLSPTNLGFLLDARVAAVHFGYLTLPEFVRTTLHTLDTIPHLTTHRGHLLNWHDTSSLEALEPRFASTVDSGNLAVCLWTLKESALAWAQEPPRDEVVLSGLQDVARLIAESGRVDACALSRRIAAAGDAWREQVPDLEDRARAYAGQPLDPDDAWWANELVVRLVEARAWLDQGMTGEVRRGLRDIASAADALVSAMDFAFLYDRRKKVLSIGFDAATGHLSPSTYGLLASEARMANFVAIAKGDVPQESWLHLGRTHILSRGKRVLISWTGTLFEYVMPALWLQDGHRTVMADSMRAAIAVQRRFARSRGVPWGFSESAHVVDGSDEHGYAACGLPELALKPMDGAPVVVSPYSSCLALLVDAPAAVRNLRRMAGLGWLGRYGFYEAVDCSRDAAEPVRCWMAHHQGMSLLALSEVLCGRPLQRAFHSNAYVQSTERLLDERVPHGLVPEKTVRPRLLVPEAPAA